MGCLINVWAAPVSKNDEQELQKLLQDPNALEIIKNSDFSALPEDEKKKLEKLLKDVEAINAAKSPSGKNQVGYQ